MQYYIASSMELVEQVKKLAYDLVGEGFFEVNHITRKWWKDYHNEVGQVSQLKDSEILNTPLYRTLGEADFKAIDDADIVILVSDKDVPMNGALVEVGYALAKSKIVYILGTLPKYTAMLTRCIYVKTKEELLKLLEKF